MTNLQLSNCLLMFSASFHSLINSSLLLASRLSHGAGPGLGVLYHDLLLRQTDLQIRRLQRLRISTVSLIYQVAARSTWKQQHVEQLSSSSISSFPYTARHPLFILIK